jgi:RNA polymerase sigma-70 factor, ECF subfamily
MAEKRASYTQSLARRIDGAYASYRTGEPNGEKLLYDALLAQANNIVRYRLRADGIFDTLAREITHRAMMGLSAFRANSKLSTWFYRIAQNEVDRALGAHIAERETSVPIYAPDLIGSDADDTPALREKARRLDQTSRAAQHAKLDADKLGRDLPRKQAKVISLLAEGYSLEEIAELTGSPLGTIRSRYNLAKRKMAGRAKKTPRSK